MIIPHLFKNQGQQDSSAIASAIRKASESDLVMRRTELEQMSAMDTARLNQEQRLFEAQQYSKDRVDIALKDYEKLKADLAEATEQLEYYKTFAHKLLHELPECDASEVFDKVLKNDFSVVNDVAPWDFTHKVGFIFKVNDRMDMLNNDIKWNRRP